jgi:hypothetical protein
VVGLVALASATAAAQTFELPAGFHERAGGAELRVLAKPADSIVVQDYAAGDVELTTVKWTFHLDLAVTRRSVADFERSLLTRTTPADVKPVSQTIELERDPILAESFDTAAGLRIYHRRLYAVDAKGRVHLWWLICRGTATAIGPCEQAQRTMKLELAGGVTLPALPPPPAAPPTPSRGEFKAPEPVVDPYRPGTVDVPAGYHEVQSSALDDMESKMRMFGRVDEVASRMFVSPDNAVKLVQVTFRMAADAGAPRALVREIDSGLTNEVGAPRVIDNEVVSEIRDDHLERRTLYAADANDRVYTFSVACFGPIAARAECVRQLATMRLRVRDQLAATDPAWDLDHHGSALGQLLRVLLVVVVPLAAILWIAKNRNRRRRSRAAS